MLLVIPGASRPGGNRALLPLLFGFMSCLERRGSALSGGEGISCIVHIFGLLTHGGDRDEIIAWLLLDLLG